MATPTYDLLDTTTLTSVVTSVTFSSIVSGYKDLVIVADIEPDQWDSWFGLRFNGDTGSNYNVVTLAGSTGSSSTNATALELYGRLVGGERCLFLINVFDYTDTGKQKAITARSGTPTTAPSSAMYGGRWASNSAITSITFFGGQGLSLDIGCKISLYGIAG